MTTTGQQTVNGWTQLWLGQVPAKGQEYEMAFDSAGSNRYWVHDA